MLYLLSPLLSVSIYPFIHQSNLLTLIGFKVNFRQQVYSSSLYTIAFLVLMGLSQPDFPGGSGKASASHAGDLGSIPGSGRASGEENGNPLQYPCLENPMDGGVW